MMIHHFYHTSIFLLVFYLNFRHFFLYLQGDIENKVKLKKIKMCSYADKYSHR